MFLLAALLMVAASAQAEIDTPYGKVRVRSKTMYRVQWSTPPDSDMVPNDSSDQDFEEQLGIDWDWNEKNVSFHFLGAYKKDLDGTPEGSIFQDYVDACGDNRQRIHLYYGYVEFHDPIPDHDLRLGRQYIFSVDESVQFDGAWLRADRVAKLNWLAAEVYGGLVSEPYSNLTQDGIAGLKLELYPTKELSFYVDTMFYKENEWALYSDWMPFDNWRLTANGTFINSHARYAFLESETEIRKTGTIFTFKIFRNFENEHGSDFIYDWQSPEDDLGEDIKNLYLEREQAYYQLDISISQQIPRQEGLSIFSRISFRKMEDNSDEDLYTTDFTSWTAGINVDEWLHLDGFHFSIGVTKWWESRDVYYEASSLSWFADLRQELFDKWEISGGYYYKTEDVNSLIEDEAANHYYGAVRYNVDHGTWAELKYEYERDDYYKEFGISDINSLTATLFVRF